MKRIIFTILIVAIILIPFLNEYLDIQLGQGSINVFNKSNMLTDEEKQWLQDHGDLVYGADNNSPPLRFLDENTGQYQGVTVDYLAALSLELGVNIRVEPMVWNDALNSLKEGNIDMCDMYPSQDRAKVYDFSKPIHYQRSIILSKTGSNIDNYKDLSGLKVAIQTGDYANEFLKRSGVDIEFIYTTDYEESLQLIGEDKVDAIVGDEPVISYFIDRKGLRDQYVISKDALFESQFILAVPKGSTTLLSIINKGVARLKKKKVMTRIQQKWFGISDTITDNRNDATLYIITTMFSLGVIVMFIISYIWNSNLKKEVAKRTQELYVSRNDLRKTFDGVTNLMIVINKDCKITNANRAYCREVKKRYKDIVGKSCNSFFRELTGDDNMCIIKETLLTGKNIRKETRKDSKIFELSSFALEDTNGDIDRVLIMMKDITELKIRDQQILQSNKMAAIGQLAAGVAHEIRNPLGIIRNSSYILKKNNEFNRERIDEAISMIDDSVTRASSIIDNLLNFSRLSPDISQDTNILMLVDGIIKLYKKELMKHGIRSQVLCDPYLNCRVNSEAIKHVLINLISNSIDAMDGGVIKIAIDRDRDILNIMYADDGIGIKEEAIDKIFNPFYTTKQPGKGTGLGLYIIYNEITKLKGEISVQSEYNRGTEFIITIPIEGEKEND